MPDIWVAGFTEGFELAIKNCSTEASKPAFMRIVIEYICQIKNINLNELRKRYSY
jgi:Tat protein secretion system quality control protein TatD with DNase activity